MKKNKATNLIVAIFVFGLLAEPNAEAIAKTDDQAAISTTSQSEAWTTWKAGKSPKGDLAKHSAAAWTAIANGPCKGIKSGDDNKACSNAAAAEVSTECTQSATVFRKQSTKWQVTGLVLILASAAFTAVGASTTITSAKVWGTLGGTTGLGAVTTTINSVSSGDQSGQAAVNTALSSFQTFIQKGGNAGAAPSDAVIYALAPTFGAQCMTAATASPNGK